MTLWPCHSKLAETGEELETTWEALFDVFLARRPFRGQFHHPGWSPAVFAPCVRLAGNVRAITALVLRFDGCSGVTLDAVRGLWGDLYGAIYTTASHAPTAHDFVVVLPYRRPVGTAEHSRLVQWAAKSLENSRFRPNGNEAAQFFYLPGTRPGDPFIAERLGTHVLDPDALLGAALAR